jgi:hypothetical protein
VSNGVIEAVEPVEDEVIIGYTEDPAEPEADPASPHPWD